VAHFLIERYVPRRATEGLAAAQARARTAAEELSGEGTTVRYVRTIFIPEDEMCFCLYEAPSAGAAAEAARRARLPFQRISEAVVDQETPVARAGQMTGCDASRSVRG
jgi:hypothetical protein